SPVATRQSPAPFRSVLLSVNRPAPTQLYTLSLHDALPICTGRPRHHGARPPSVPVPRPGLGRRAPRPRRAGLGRRGSPPGLRRRSEEHTSELQSRENLVCRLLLEKKKDARSRHPTHSSPTS